MSITTKLNIFPKHLFVGAQRLYSQAPTPTSLHGKDGKFDIAVIGGGIVGAASARELITRHPNLKIVLIEKENDYGLHQTGHNSGVVHAGIYYKPGSLKAKLCVQGLELSYKYFDEKKIPYSKCGKLIVASNQEEVPGLLELLKRGQQNGVKDLSIFDSNEMRNIEPNVKGVKGLWSPHTGIVDWKRVCKSYVDDFESKKGKSFLNFQVTNFIDVDDPNYPVLIVDTNSNKAIQATYVLTCCGLHSDTIAVLTGCPEEPKIIPFRGEYLYLKPKKSSLVKANIYPVPDARFPFLGVHLTPRIDGRIIIGPNAILAFSKEGYRYRDVNLKELKSVITFAGFQKLALKYAGFGMVEMARSIITPLQVSHVGRYVENLESADVEAGPAGVRAQAMDKQGNLIEDFVFDSGSGAGAVSSRVLHCRNAPSPGATSSLAIGKMIADKMNKVFHL